MARTAYPLMVPKVKPPDTTRIFVFGESAAYGDPEPEFSMSRILEALLEGRHPDRKFEVINTAMTAINSHVILPIARDCASQQGDVLGDLHGEQRSGRPLRFRDGIWRPIPKPPHGPRFDRVERFLHRPIHEEMDSRPATKRG